MSEILLKIGDDVVVVTDMFKGDVFLMNMFNLNKGFPGRAFSGTYETRVSQGFGI